MIRTPYPDDLSDQKWKFIEPIAEKPYSTKGGCRPKHSKREFLDAIFYWLGTGCSGRHLPYDFPPWQSVYTQFRR